MFHLWKHIMLLHPSRSLHVSSHNLGSIPFNSIWLASDFFRYLTDIFVQVEEKFLSNMFSSHEMGIISFLAHQINSNNASKHLFGNGISVVEFSPNIFRSCSESTFFSPAAPYPSKNWVLQSFLSLFLYFFLNSNAVIINRASASVFFESYFINCRRRNLTYLFGIKATTPR